MTAPDNVIDLAAERRRREDAAVDEMTDEEFDAMMLILSGEKYA